MIQLPQFFLDQMQKLLSPKELDAFINSYNTPTIRGLHLNKLKAQQNLSLLGLEALQPVPWCATGRYYTDSIRPSKSIFHHAGLFYIQEPSAMCPAEVLAPKPGHKVLDLCAAPGGKSSQIAGCLQGSGLLVSNDASPTRSRALVKNLERMGVTNAVVVTEQPKKLAMRFPNFFDRILVDAPCSGEGMFRRDLETVKAYTANKPEACMAIQTEILRHAAKMLKPGGYLVYSTCTFNMNENEHMILQFCKSHPHLVPVPIDHSALGISKGFDKLTEAGRIFPHLAQGEGHFIALLKKVSDTEPTSVIESFNSPTLSKKDAKKKQAKNQLTDNVGMLSKSNHAIFNEFCSNYLRCTMPLGFLVAHTNNIYLQPEPLNLDGIRVARSGWFLGEIAKDRFVPSHALAMGLKKQDVRNTIELPEEHAMRYLRGESLDTSLINGIAITDSKNPKPWVLICYEGYPLGWAKLVQGRLKNNLPVGLVIK